MTTFESESYPAGLMSDLAVPGAPDEFGPAFVAEPLGLDSASDVLVAGDIIFALVNGGLSVLRERDTGELERIGRLDNLRPTRQLAIEGTTAVVTMREGGLAVIDIADPASPKLAAWFDTIEFATGLALAEGRAYVTNRHYGVEIIDVSDKCSPRWLGVLRAGEAQSVAVRGSIACIGAWRDRQLVVADVSDPRQPRVIGIAPVDGYADGVTIIGDRCFVATGHHARGIDGFPHEGRSAVSWDMLKQGYGRGHGVEVFDIGDPRQPRLLHRLKTPPAMSKSPDAWRVVEAGRYMLHADSVNGVFVLDLAGPEPTFVGHARIDMPNRRAPASGPSLQERAEPVISVAMSASGTIYAAGEETDLYRIRTPFLPGPPAAPPPRPAPLGAGTAPRRDPRAIFRGDGMVHAVVSDGKTLFAAAGSDGLVGLTPSGEELFRVPFARAARDVVRDGELLVVAAGHEGLALLTVDDGACTALGTLPFADPVRFVALLKPGLVLAAVGKNRIAMVDISRPATPRLVTDFEMRGNVYGRHIVDGCLGDRFAIALSQTGGFRWLDLRDPANPVGGPQTGRRSCPITEGAALASGKALIVRLGGYYLLEPGEEIDPREATIVRLADGGEIIGTPTIWRDRLIATNRVSGSVHLIDISNLASPRSLGRLRLDGQVGRPVALGGRLYVPAGHAGLIALELNALESSEGK